MCCDNPVAVHGRAIVQDIALGLQVGARAGWTYLSKTASATEAVFRSPDAFNYCLLGITSVLSSIQPYSAFRVSPKALEQIQAAKLCLSATRLSQTVNYVVNGKLLPPVLFFVERRDLVGFMVWRSPSFLVNCSFIDKTSLLVPGVIGRNFFNISLKSLFLLSNHPMNLAEIE